MLNQAEIPTQPMHLHEPMTEASPRFAGGLLRDARWPWLLLAITAAVVPQLGYWDGWVQQSSFKNGVTWAGTLLALFLFLVLPRSGRSRLHGHGAVWMWLVLAAAAALWSIWHPGEGGTDTVRWMVVGLAALLVLNQDARERFLWVCRGVHVGAALAGVLAALQVWTWIELPGVGTKWWPSGTFSDAEQLSFYLLAALPFSLYLHLIAHVERRWWDGSVLAISMALNACMVVLAGSWVQIGLCFAMLVAWTWLEVLHVGKRSRARRQTMSLNQVDFFVMVGALAIFLLVPTARLGPVVDMPQAIGPTGYEVLRDRFQQIGQLPAAVSEADIRMIRANPILGVGSGQWRVEVPRYLDSGLSLPRAPADVVRWISEYGVVGALMLAFLVAYTVVSLWRNRWISQVSPEEAPLRLAMIGVVLAVLFSLCLGTRTFEAPLLLLLALSLGALAASDLRMSIGGALGAHRVATGATQSRYALILLVLMVVALIWPASQAVRAQRAYLEAISIRNLGVQRNLSTEELDRMANLARLGARVDASYTGWLLPLAEDLAARGRWADAAFLYGRALRVLPNDLSVWSGAVNASAAGGDTDTSSSLLERALGAWPREPLLRMTQLQLAEASGKPDFALALARQAVADGLHSPELLDKAAALALAQGDVKFAVVSLQHRLERWPDSGVETMLRIGHVHLHHRNDAMGALGWYRKALAQVPLEEQPQWLLRIPSHLWSALPPDGQGLQLVPSIGISASLELQGPER